MLSHLRWLVFGAGLLAVAGEFTPRAAALETDSTKVAELLARADVWIMPQPKAAAVGGQSFDLANCQGIRLVGEASEAPHCAAAFHRFSGRVRGQRRDLHPARPGWHQIVLGVFPDGKPAAGFPKATAADLRDLGEQGYWLSVDQDGIVAAATGKLGLYYAVSTIGQIATDRTKLPGLVIRDWPSLQYRGAGRREPRPDADDRDPDATRRRDRHCQDEHARAVHRASL